MVAELETKLAEWTEWASAMTAQLAERDAALVASNALVAAVQTELEAVKNSQSVAHDAQTHAVVLEATVAELVEKVKANESVIEAAHQQLAEWETKRDELVDQVTEKERLAELAADKLREVESHVSTLTSKIAELTAHADAMEAIRQENIELASSVDALRTASRDEEQSAAENLANVTAEKDALAAHVAELNGEAESLRAQLEEAEAATAVVPRLDVTLESELEALKARLAEQEERMIELHSQLLVRDATVKALADNADRMAPKSPAAAVESDPALAVELELVQLEKAEMITKLDEWTHWAASMTTQLSERDAVVEKLHAELEAAASAKADEADIESVRTEKEALTARVADLAGQVASLADTRAQLEAARVEIEELKSQSAQPADVSELEAKLTEWSEWATAMTSQLAERDAAITANQDLIAQSQSEIRELKAKLEASVVESSPVVEVEPDQTELLALQAKLAAVQEESVAATAAVVAEKAELEAKVIEWAEWAEAMTNQLKEKDAFIAEMSGSSSEVQSVGIQQTEEIVALKEKVAELIAAQEARSLSTATEEETEVLLSVYRQEIDRLANENAELRSASRGTAKAVSSSSTPEPASGRKPGGAWWKTVVTPFLTETDTEDKPGSPDVATL